MSWYDEDEPREQSLAELDRKAEERAEYEARMDRLRERSSGPLWFCSECHEPNVSGRVTCATCREPRCTCTLTEPDADGQRDLIEKPGCPRHG